MTREERERLRQEAAAQMDTQQPPDEEALGAGAPLDAAATRGETRPMGLQEPGLPPRDMAAPEAGGRMPDEPPGAAGLVQQEREAGEVEGASKTAAIGVEQIRRFNEILQRYKAGKVNLERRLIENEQWWKLRHSDGMRNTTARDADKSAWLANVIMQKHADAMDAYPTCSCLPHEPGDRAEARKLSSIIPAILRQTEFERVYSDCWWQKLKGGTGCYQVTWDGSKLGGLGDIAICKINLLNLFWEPGVEDLQDSAYIFHLALADKERLQEHYPALEGKAMSRGPLTVSEFVYDDAVRTDDKALVVDCYYKRRGVLHYCKYCGETVLFATENEEDYAAGWYAHGRYPFVLDPLFPIEGSCCGYGYIDYGKTTQQYIDKLTGAIMENALASATPRWFIRQDSGVNEEEYADFGNHFIHAGGNLGEDAVKQIRPVTLPGIYLNVLDSRINEIKETLGNRDAATGGVTASVTSAAGIASLQEAAGKLSRDAEKAGYRAFEQIVYLCIELIRQFYDVQRSFRITGQMGQEEYIAFDNTGIAAQTADGGIRVPQFDIDVQAQKENPYTKESYNELAVQLFSMGAFRPDMAEQTLMMLDMMDFKGKDRLQQKVQQQSQMARMLEQAMAILQGQAGIQPDVSGRGAQPGPGTAQQDGADTVTETESQAEHPFVSAAKERARSASAPR